MFHRVALGVVVIGVVAVLTAADLTAAAKEGMHEGIVVGIEANKLIMTDKAGKNQHMHIVPTSAIITCDGKECRLQDLQKGFVVKVTMEQKGAEIMVTRIEAKKNSP